MVEKNTHLDIDTRLCGELSSLEEGQAEVIFTTTDDMAVDDRGLVHGGFVFGLADHAAMAAVNDPKVVLASADLRFVAPVTVGEEVRAEAEVVESKGRKRIIAVTAAVGEREVLRGTMIAFVLERHVLDPTG